MAHNDASPHKAEQHPDDLLSKALAIPPITNEEITKRAEKSREESGYQALGR